MKKAMMLLVSCLAACAPFQDSPFSDYVLHSETNLNAQAVGRISDPESDDGIIRLAIFADSHENYKDLDKTIQAINRTDGIDFVVGLGDLTNMAYNMEYDQFLVSYLRFLRPAVTIIGNHDSIGAGQSIFRKVFGPLNFMFEAGNSRFVFFNSANWENPGTFDVGWLLNAVQSSSKQVFIFSHCSLLDAERFPPVSSTMNAILNDPHVKAVFNGHQHVWDYRNVAGVPLVQAPRVSGVRWLLVEIQGTQFRVTEVNGKGSASDTLKP
jgi:predicted phosphodiesterase